MSKRFDKSVVANPGYKYYALLMLVMVYAINIMDRQVLALLLQDIKLELALTDTQLGLLGGVAFAFFYSVMGIPLARWADRGSRKTVLVWCLVLWSAATVLCGFAIGFITLIAARIATAIGEAGSSPASHAMIADHFKPKERATALAIFALGVPLGSIIGNLASGWLNEYFAWRVVFVAVGAPGIVVALLMHHLLHDAVEAAPSHDRTDGRDTSGPHLGASLQSLAGRRSYVHMCLAAGLHSVVWYAGSTWNASFLIRSHDIGTGAAGSWIASFAVIGLFGTFFGGFVADRMALKKREQRWYLWIPCIAILVSIPFQFFSYLSESLVATIAAFWVMTALAATFFGPSYAVSQTLAAPQARALAASILIFVQTLIGLGAGPFLVGIMSDYLAPTMGEDSLRYALVAVGIVNLWSAYHYFQAGTHYREDLAQATVAHKRLRHRPAAAPELESRKDNAQLI